MTQTKIWFSVDEDGSEFWFDNKPYKSPRFGEWMTVEGIHAPLFPGAIKAITGVTLSWQDEPLEWVVGERQVVPAGYKVYECTDCHKYSMIENNGDIIPGCCQFCHHPLFND